MAPAEEKTEQLRSQVVGRAHPTESEFWYSLSKLESNEAHTIKEVLVEIVKLIQKRGMSGEKGGWKDFLKFYDKKLGDSLSDPARRSPDALMAFIKTFKEESDLQLFAKVLKCHLNREGAKQILKSENNESPEESLVRLTFEHPLYPIEYSFPSHEEDWSITKLSKKNINGRSNKLLAVDCEMVLCEDGSEALAKICVVDRDLRVRLHEFVNPGKVVADYRTSITGVSAEDLSGATSSLADIKRSIRKLLNGSILVGHSLSNDLKALKIDHARVIDTSFIFKYGDESTKRRPSLNDLCKAVLGCEVRKKDAPHNCQDDACAAMKLVLAKLEKGFDDVIPVIKDYQDNVQQVNTGMNKLLIHRIPISMPSEDLNQIIHGEFTVVAQKSKGKGDRYSAFAIFETPEEAHQTFENIVGDEAKDSAGLPQKSVTVQLSSGQTDTIYIRKMTRDNAIVSNKKRPCPAEEIPSESKVLKTDQADDVSAGKACVQADDVSARTACVEHVEEIKWLKSVLSKRDEEISSLHKIIAALTRKQGL